MEEEEEEGSPCRIRIIRVRIKAGEGEVLVVRRNHSRICNMDSTGEEERVEEMYNGEVCNGELYTKD